MIILKRYLLNKNTNLSEKQKEDIIINFPWIVTRFHAKQKPGYLWHLAKTLVADCIRDVYYTNLYRGIIFMLMFICPNTLLDAQEYYTNPADVSKVIFAVHTTLSEQQKPYF